MKTFKINAAQGDLTIRRLGDNGNGGLPAGYTAMIAEDGKFIVGHSETGHHHVIDAHGAEVGVMDKPPEGMRILYAILREPAVLEHLRPHDTHEPIALEPGIYEIRGGREFDPYAELARQSQD